MKKKFLGRLLTMLLVAAMVFTLLPASAIAAAEWWGGDEYADDTATQATDDYKYNIFFLDCGRKYYSVDSIKQFIDNASAAGFNYIQLAVGNDGLRFLLDDMSLTVNGTTYDSAKVSAAIHAGNEAYYNFDVDELTQSEMDTIIAYANSKGMGVIPCVNTPGHMDAIIDCMESLGMSNVAFDAGYYGVSVRTIDVTNSEAVAFTQALLEKYVAYFAGKGCKFFNMGADEYANDKLINYAGMGFGYLQDKGTYSYYVDYVNAVAKLIEKYQATPMAFNDGIYYGGNTTSGTFDKNIIICYWSSGWGSGANAYAPMSASNLASKGFKLINTDGSYYWVLGKSDWQCDASKASGFSYKEFQGSTIDKPAGSMFCVWSDYPGAETESSVISKTAATIAAFGKTLPAVSSVIPEPGITITPSDGTVSGSTKLDSANETASVTLSASEVVTWTWYPTLVNLVSADNTVNTYAATESLSAKSVIVTPVAGASGNAVITVTDDSGKTANYTIAVYDSSAPEIADTITITVGGTATRTFTGDVRDTLKKDDLDESTATVSANYEKKDGETKTDLGSRVTVNNTNNSGPFNGVISDGAGHYMTVNGNAIGSTNNVSDATRFTVTKTGSGNSSRYVIKVSTENKYLNITSSGVSLSDSSSGVNTLRYNGNGGFYYYYSFLWSYSYYLYYSNGNWGVQEDSGNGYLYNVIETTTDPVDETTVTFTGVSVGTTYVTIDGKLYKIVVTDKAPDNAMTSNAITLEHWITNVHATSTEGGYTYTVSISQSEAQSEAGIEITSKKFANAYWGTEEVYYWKAVRLASSAKQTTTAGADQTAAGTTLTHIRYYNNAWQYKTTDGTWHYFLTGDQLVAYYLKKVVVTPQINTYYKDWGYNTDDIGGCDYGQVALSVAVVYPNGTISPAEDNIFGKSTTIFNYWNNGSGTHKERRDMGIVLAENNSNYNISKITVTNGLRTGYTADLNGSSNSQWSSSNTITWDKIEDDAGNKWYDETVVWDENSGTEPVVNAANKTGDDDAVYVFQGANTAKLVLIYLKPVQKSTNLNVVYYNDNNKEEIFSMQVAMTYNQGDTEPTYANSLYLYGTVNADGTVTGGTLIAENKSSWSSNVVGDTEYLPDAAYVVNAGKEAQTFSKTLSTIPGVAAKYKSGVYQYISADISSDGKTLTLHYAINASKLDKKYIFDFGLPIEIPLSELVDNYDDIEYLSVDGTNLFENSVKTAHGTLSYDSSSKSIVFTLDKTVDTQAPLTGSFRVKYTNATELSKAITIALIPASNVLYEESFLTQGAGWTKGTTSAPTAAQQTQKVGETDKNVFGYDDVYKSAIGELGVWKVENLETRKLSSALTTSFYGNTFDLIGNCDKDTGRVLLLIQGNGQNKIIDIDTRYNGGSISQVPLAHVELGGSDASYNVSVYAAGLDATSTTVSTQSVMRVARASSADSALQSLLSANGLTMADVEYTKTSAADNAAAKVASNSTFATYAANGVSHEKGTHVEIDSFRVYRSSNSSYPANEQNVTYVNVLYAVGATVTAYTENGDVTNIEVSKYEAAGGPQNEIYLHKNQSVVFQISGVDSIQVSLRAVSGIAKWNGSNITSNTEMYYTLSKDSKGNFTIANSSDSLLAIGNVKLPAGSSIIKTSELSNDTILASVRMALNAVPVDPEPEQPTVFVPEHFSIRDYATRFFRSKLVTLRIDFSKDVSYVEIDGRKYTPNKLASWFGYYTVTFTDTIGRNDDYFYKVVFFDANGNPSETQIVYGK